MNENEINAVLAKEMIATWQRWEDCGDGDNALSDITGQAMELIRECPPHLCPDGLKSSETTLRVIVPLELLKRVLDQAEDDSLGLQVQMACNSEDNAASRKEREGIHELRRIAGIVEAEQTTP
jgi:hypothetical protein